MKEKRIEREGFTANAHDEELQTQVIALRYALGAAGDTLEQLSNTLMLLADWCYRDGDQGAHDLHYLLALEAMEAANDTVAARAMAR